MRHFRGKHQVQSSTILRSLRKYRATPTATWLSGGTLPRIVAPTPPRHSTASGGASVYQTKGCMHQRGARSFGSVFQYFSTTLVCMFFPWKTVCYAYWQPDFFFFCDSSGSLNSQPADSSSRSSEEPQRCNPRSSVGAACAYTFAVAGDTNCRGAATTLSSPS